MKIKNTIALLFLLALFSSGLTKAQIAGVDFTLGFPMGEFKENVDRLGYGISGHFLFFTPSPEAPFTAGLNIGFLNYGSESRRERFSTTIPDVFVDVDRSNNLMNFHVMFRAAWPTGVVRPYAEGLFGGSYLFTETTIRSRGTDDVASTNNFDDFAWSYGGGGGFLIRVTENASEEIGSVFIDLRARYLLGTQAEYLKEGSIRIENGHAFYDVSKSKTDILTVHLGVTAYFNSLFTN
jgi:hypothetical protein